MSHHVTRSQRQSCSIGIAWCCRELDASMVVRVGETPGRTRSPATWRPGRVYCAGPSFRPTVAVGTAIAGRPPHRSVRARLRIRLLPRMNGVESLIGIGMQNARGRNPPVQQRVETIPPHLRALTATD